MLTPDGVAALLAARRAEAPAADAHRRRIFGFFGRAWPLAGGGGPKYDFHDTAPGPAPIALTIALLTRRSLCAETAARAGLMADVVAGGKPLWNGEDIFHSLVATRLTGLLPEILPAAGTTAPLASWGAAVSTRTNRLSAHFAYRDRFLRAAIQRLGLDGLYGTPRPAADA